MSSIYFTPIAFAAPLNSSVVNSPLGQLDQALDDFLAGNISVRRLNFGSPVTRTISSDAIARTRSYHTLIPQSGTTDDLATITGGSVGDELKLEINDASYTITVKHNTGNIVLSSGQNLVLNSVNQTLSLWFNGTKWVDSGGSVGLNASYQLIESQILTGSQATITIPSTGSFPSTFLELEFLLTLRGDQAVTNVDLKIQFNGDTGANYNPVYQYFGGGGSTTYSAGINQNYILLGTLFPGNTASANRFGNLKMVAPRYARTDRHKVVQFFGEVIPNDTAAGFYIVHGAGLWKNTSALTSITLTPGGGNFVQGSTVEVWGKR